jgi:hypothetical protein
MRKKVWEQSSPGQRMLTFQGASAYRHPAPVLHCAFLPVTRFADEVVAHRQIARCASNGIITYWSFHGTSPRKCGGASHAPAGASSLAGRRLKGNRHEA